MFNFTKRKNAVDIRRLVRRIRDLTMPNSPFGGNQTRRQERANRAIPTMICPWDNGEPAIDRIHYGLTRDVSDHGVGLVTTVPLEVNQVVIAYWPDGDDPGQPWFFLGEARRLASIGGGFWTLGVEFVEFINQSHSSQLRELMPCARELRPMTAEPISA